MTQEERYALVLPAIAPVHATGSIRATQVSQAQLGSTVQCLRRRGSWHECRLEDGYLGWVHRGYLRMVDRPTMERWQRATRLFSLGANVSRDGLRMTDLPWGARVQVADGRGEEVRLPDGRVGEASGELIPESELAERFPATGEAVVETAARWTGAPYLWGGRTRAGVDCSGLVQNLFAVHGIALPRDSPQQAEVGEKVEAADDFSALRAGDLLYFAERGHKITHVALSEGGSRIVHSWLGGGGVGRTDLLRPDEREAPLRGRFRLARRVIPAR